MVTTVGNVGRVGTVIDGNCGGAGADGDGADDGRTRGPVLLSDRALAPGRAVAAGDRGPTSGRARLSYWRAAEVFAEASGGRTFINCATAPSRISWRRGYRYPRLWPSPDTRPCGHCSVMPGRASMPSPKFPPTTTPYADAIRRHQSNGLFCWADQRLC